MTSRSPDVTESRGGVSVSNGEWLRICFNQVAKEFIRLSEIAAMAGCGLSRIEAVNVDIYDIACLRLDLISDCYISSFQTFLNPLLHKICFILFQNDP